MLAPIFGTAVGKTVGIFSAVSTGDRLARRQLVKTKMLKTDKKANLDETFEENVKNYVSVYEKVSRSAVVLSKKLLYQMDAMTFENALESGVDVNTIARMTEDCQSGIARFLNK